MAHFLYPMRNPTSQEKSAFSFPQEGGIMKARHDRWSIGVGSRLVAKGPFSVGNFLCLQNEEFVVTEKKKSENNYVIMLIRDNRVTLEANGDELDAHFYVVPGELRTVKNSDVQKLLGK